MNANETMYELGTRVSIFAEYVITIPTIGTFSMAYMSETGYYSEHIFKGLTLIE